MAKATVLTPNVGLDEKSRDGLIKTLNTLVADQHLLYVQTRRAHWNITGINFYALHNMLEDQYDLLKASIDDVAERVQMLGGTAIGSMSKFLDFTRLEEKVHNAASWRDTIDLLRRDHEQLAALLRNDIEIVTDDFNDEGTGDLLVSMLRMHEEIAWMLRATLTEERESVAPSS